MDKRKWWIAAAIVFVLIALLALLTPLYAEICEKNAYTGDKECARHNFPMFIFLYLGQILEARAGAITGVATAILAVITWGLVKLGKDGSETQRAQLRAYISVVIGSAVFQDERLQFEAKPTILNNGQTPAYNVRYRAKADIFTDSVAAAFVFTEPPDVPRSQSSIGPRENRIMSVIVDHRVGDSEVAAIKYGDGKSLWVWGVVHYDDVFGVEHYVQFCQKLIWLTDDSNIFGTYDGRFGRSD